MASFKKPAGNAAPQKKSWDKGGSSGGYQKRGAPKGDEEYKAQRVAGLFRHDGKNGVFWSSPPLEDGYRYTLNLNEEYDKDPERQNEFILRKQKVRPRD